MPCGASIDLAPADGRNHRWLHQPDGFLVEGDENVRAEPAPFISNNPIGKIAARLEQSEPRFGSRSVHGDVRSVDQASNRRGDVGWIDFVASQHPNKFTKGRRRQRDEFGLAQCSLGNFALLRVIFQERPHQHVGIGGQPHRLPAQPRAMISFISSIDSDRPFFLPFRLPKDPRFFRPAGPPSLRSDRQATSPR